jgi:predicted nucleotidyltransferase
MAVKLSFIEEEILNHLSKLLEKEIPEVVKLIVFGSRVKGESTENSDLDIAVIVDIDNIDKKLWEMLWRIKWRVLKDLRSEEFPLSLIPITKRNFLSNNLGLEKSIKREGKVWWERKS